MMTFRDFLKRISVFGATGLFGCDDGRLDVLEPESRGTSGAAGSRTATGGSAGSGTTGGASATGGAGAAGSSSGGGSPLPSPFVLDDFEDGDTQSLSIPDGYWYSQPDPTCSAPFSIEIIAGGPGNTHAIRTRGGSCTAWGALVGLDLGGTVETFDASSFDSIRFRARVEPNSVTELSVSLLDPLHFDTVIDATSEWQEFVLPLDGFVLNDRAPAQPFENTRLTHLQFFVFSAEPFDFWLDDLAFVRSE